MATTPVEFDYLPSQTLTVELRAFDTDPSDPDNGAGGDTATEKTNDLGRYSISVTEALAGWYHVAILSGGSVVGRRVVFMVDDTATKYAVEPDPTLLPIVDGKTPQEAARIAASILAGKVSGAGTGTEVFVGLDGSTTRVTVTVDNDGNRTAVSYA